MGKVTTVSPSRDSSFGRSGLGRTLRRAVLAAATLLMVAAPGAGPASLWQPDRVTGELTPFSTIDSPAHGGASLGGLAFDQRTQQLFVAERGTGLIHRLSLDGTDRGTFDHGTDGRPSGGLAPVPLDAAPTVDITNAAFDTATPSTWGFAAPPRRVFGLATWKNRLYYAVA